MISQIVLTNEANTMTPASADEMNAVIVGNFLTQSSSVEVDFPHDGTWYDYFSGTAFNTSTINLGPGEFKIFTDVELDGPDIITAIDDEKLSTRIAVYPNPAVDQVSVSADTDLVYFFIYSLSGQMIQKGKFNTQTIDVSNLARGSYIIETISRMGERDFQRLIKE